MKNIFYLLLLILPNFIFAQNGTTLEEYKYLTKGYAYQKEMGLDGGKAGYEVNKLFTASNGITFSGLFQTTNKNLRGVLMTIGKYAEKPIYLCLPTNDAPKSVKAMFEKSVQESLSLAIKTQFDKALLEFALNRAGDNSTPTAYIGETEKNVGVPNGQTKSEDRPADEYGLVIPLKPSANNEFAKKTPEISAPVEINTRAEALISLNDRGVVTAPLVLGQNGKKGTVVIKVCVDADGNIKTAKFTQRGSTTLDAQLKNLAIDASKRAQFVTSLEKEQCGTITYKFN